MPISGKQAIKILQKHGFIISRQKGSHVVLTAETATGKKIAVVPNHREMKKERCGALPANRALIPTELGL
ncbi:MAG: type II toxin-antitoxin system HicA family toxin [Candidatus Saccharibacteria bacterium]